MPQELRSLSGVPERWIPLLRWIPDLQPVGGVCGSLLQVVSARCHSLRRPKTPISNCIERFDSRTYGISRWQSKDQNRLVLRKKKFVTKKMMWYNINDWATICYEKKLLLNKATYRPALPSSVIFSLMPTRNVAPPVTRTAIFFISMDQHASTNTSSSEKQQNSK